MLIRAILFRSILDGARLQKKNNLRLPARSAYEVDRTCRAQIVQTARSARRRLRHFWKLISYIYVRRIVYTRYTYFQHIKRTIRPARAVRGMFARIIIRVSQISGANRAKTNRISARRIKSGLRQRLIKVKMSESGRERVEGGRFVGSDTVRSPLIFL